MINPSVTQGDLNEINGADGRVFKISGSQVTPISFNPHKTAKHCQICIKLSPKWRYRNVVTYS